MTARVTFKPSGAYEQTYATGARARDYMGSLAVCVPNRDHHSRTRSDALAFARSIWGDSAALCANLGPVKLQPPYGLRPVNGTRYSVVIVGDRAESLRARRRGYESMTGRPTGA